MFPMSPTFLTLTMAPIFNMAFFWHLFLEDLTFVKNFKIQKFFHILEKQTPKKILLPKNKFKMAAKFKMAYKTKFDKKDAFYV
jgi:hypothetical protein